jgi:hypothetical protein
MIDESKWQIRADECRMNLLHLATVTSNYLGHFLPVMPLKVGQATVQHLEAELIS